MHRCITMGASERSWKWKWKLLPRSNVPCRFFRPATPQPKRKRLRLMYQSDKARADDGWKLGEGLTKTRSFRVGCFQMVVLVKNPPEISLTTKMSNILRSSSSFDHGGVGVYTPWISKLSIDCQWSTSRKSQRSRGNYCGGSCWVMLSGFLGGPQQFAADPVLRDMKVTWSILTLESLLRCFSHV